MFLANLSKREKFFFYLMVAIISFSLIYNFALKPQGAQWGKLNQELLTKEKEFRRNMRYLQQKDNVKSIYLKYAEYVKRKGSDEEEMAILLNEVEKEASAQGIHIINIRPKPVKDLVFCKKYILEMNCEAALEKYLEFIYNLQKSAKLISVEKIKLVSQGKDNPLLKAEFLITKILPM